MQYRREIDGLRAVAVLPVIFFHAGFEAFAGGFVGVDIFFVISGYLITSILIGDLERGQFSILRFYERRARRILPALFAVIAVSLPVAVLLMTPPQLESFAESIVATALFASNFYFVWDQAAYFDPQTELYPLLHTWSLAVEEQFYIVFPPLLAALWFLGRKTAFWVLGAIGVASFLWADQGWHSRSVDFYLPLTRAWELLAGAFCAFVLSRHQLKSNEILAAAGIAMILASIALYDGSLPWPGRYAVLPVLGTMLVVLFAGPGTWSGRLLGLPLLVGIGLISYSAYLWHQPILAFARLYFVVHPPVWTILALIGLTFALAYLSWRFVEQPFRKGGHPLLARRPVLFAVSGAGLAACIAVGLVGILREGLPNRFPAPEFVAAGQFELASAGNGHCFYSLADLPELEVGEAGLTCMLGAEGDDDRRVLLYGDSFAGHWEPFWNALGAEYGVAIRAVSTNWCFPSLGEGFTGPRRSEAYQQCLINRSWLEAHAGDYDMIVLGGDWRAVEEDGYAEELLAAIAHLTEETGAEIMIMPAPPAFYRQSVEQWVHFGDGELIDHPERNELIAEMHATFRDLAAAEPRIHFPDRNSLFGDYLGSGGALSAEGYPYSLEGQHISIYGARAAAEHVLSSDRTDPLSALLPGIGY